jgi:adenylate cyclase
VTTELTTAQLEELGLYDPDAPDAEERLALLELALACNATVDDIRRGIEEGRLHAVGAERIVLGGNETITLDDAIHRSGIDREFALRIWRALGFVIPDPEMRVCTERDVGVFEYFALTEAVFGAGPALALARTAGNSLARLADGAISNARSVLEAPLRSEGGSNIDVARTFAEAATAIIPPLYPVIETVHRHHLVDAARRYSLWGSAPTEEHTTNAVVGFADVVGSTALGHQLTNLELDAMLATFEERALGVCARPGSRLVKLIGDEILFVSGDAAEAIEIARRLNEDPDLPPMRTGIASGEVVTRDGDVYGTVVNLAARLVALAPPGGVLLDAETARRLRPDATKSLGTRVAQGFDEPVEVYAPAD